MSDYEGAPTPTGIAVIGMAGRFPGARNVAEFWRNLCGGVESVRDFSDEELLASGVDPALLRNPAYVKRGGYLDGAEEFDAEFFGYSPREAEYMDPQHRLFLECSWEALEDAGYNPEDNEGSIGVFAGCGDNEYLLQNLLPNRRYSDARGMRAHGHLEMAIESRTDFMPTRVSYKLDLKGPSVAIQTACSTSLVAAQMAWQSLMNYQCDMALTGGVSLKIPQKDGYLYREGTILSPDGRCRTFDAKASGTVWGEGVGVVVLKRLEDALADGDCVHAVILGAAVNNDGRKIGFNVPSAEGQSEVIVTAQALAGVEADSIGYIEAHGTGTLLGDPIELAGLTRAFRLSTERRNFCAIGSVKSNIGHTDVAAGVVSLIATVLALEHEQLPPTLHFERANPDLDLGDSPFFVNDRLRKWPRGAAPRRAGVSSFGVGGTNAHMVLEEAPVTGRKPSARANASPWQLLVLSARTKTALDAAGRNLSDHLERNSALGLVDVAHTLRIGRKCFPHRQAAVCQSLEDAARVMTGQEPKRLFTGERRAGEFSVAFLFSGQGAQYVGMARDLYDSEPVFRKRVDDCLDVLKPHVEGDLREILYPSDQASEGSAEQLAQTALAQPALFVIEYALAELWGKWGIHPVAMIGHSVGEYVAACLAGVFPLEGALELVAARGRLMQAQPPGAMLAVALPEEELLPLLGDELELAAVNGPANCSVSGPFEAIDAFEAKLAMARPDGDEVHSTRLHTSHAFHSRAMEPVLGPFAEVVKKIGPKPPRIPFVSNLTGTWITEAEATSPVYWATHVRRAVRFADGVRTLLDGLHHVLLESGPGNSLCQLARQQKDKPPGLTLLSSLRHPRQTQSDVAFILETLGRLWTMGAPVDWKGYEEGRSAMRVSLPTYPFERRRHWMEPPWKRLEVEELQK